MLRWKRQLLLDKVFPGSKLLSIRLGHAGKNQEAKGDKRYGPLHPWRMHQKLLVAKRPLDVWEDRTALNRLLYLLHLICRYRSRITGRKAHSLGGIQINFAAGIRSLIDPHRKKKCENRTRFRRFLLFSHRPRIGHKMTNDLRFIIQVKWINDCQKLYSLIRVDWAVTRAQREERWTDKLPRGSAPFRFRIHNGPHQILRRQSSSLDPPGLKGEYFGVPSIPFQFQTVAINNDVNYAATERCITKGGISMLTTMWGLQLI